MACSILPRFGNRALGCATGQLIIIWKIAVFKDALTKF
jgi:hypothetical protein